MPEIRPQRDDDERRKAQRQHTPHDGRGISAPCDADGEMCIRDRDRHPRGEAHGRGARKAAASGRHPAQAGHRPGRSRTARDGGPVSYTHLDVYKRQPNF